MPHILNVYVRRQNERKHLLTNSLPSVEVWNLDGNVNKYTEDWDS